MGKYNVLDSMPCEDICLERVGYCRSVRETALALDHYLITTSIQAGRLKTDDSQSKTVCRGAERGGSSRTIRAEVLRLRRGRCFGIAFAKAASADHGRSRGRRAFTTTCALKTVEKPTHNGPHRREGEARSRNDITEKRRLHRQVWASAEKDRT